MDKNEVLDELKSVLRGKTFDALLPPLIYATVNRFADLNTALAVAVTLAGLIGAYRLIKKQNWYYALAGLLGVALSSGLAFFTRNAAGYFIPAILSSLLLLLLALITLIIGKPLAAWASHLTRGWPLAWFWRADVIPAYREVTWGWFVFIALRLLAQTLLFQAGDVYTLAWINILLGWPMIIAVLIITYIYGIKRLHQLGGPGVEEFKNNARPPWKGQSRGF